MKHCQSLINKMFYFRQQCKKRPPDILLQYENDIESCISDENDEEIDYPEDEHSDESYDEDGDYNEEKSANRVSGRIFDVGQSEHKMNPYNDNDNDEDEDEHEDEDEDEHDYNENLVEVDDDHDEWGFHQSYSFLIRRHTTRNPEPDAVKKCCVCTNTVRLQNIRLDEIDHHPSFVFHEDMAFMNPCKQHTICVSCIRRSILSNGSSVLRDGFGNYPCLGDVNCTNDLRQRTTTYIYQLREIFSDDEWSNVIEMVRNYETSNVHFTHHPFCVPLIPVSEITVNMLYNQINHILDQDHPKVQCPICTVTIQKTTACYAMRHCDWEMCWMCSKLERRLSHDHWKVCPRYDSNKYWKQFGYLCEESICYDDNRSCSVPNHAPGIEKMNYIRKIFQLYHLYESIESSHREALKQKLKHDHPSKWDKITHLLTQYELYRMDKTRVLHIALNK